MALEVLIVDDEADIRDLVAHAPLVPGRLGERLVELRLVEHQPSDGRR